MEFAEIETALASNPDALAFVKGLHDRASKFTPEIEAEVGKLGEYKGHSEAYAKLLSGTGAKDADSLLTDFGNLKSSNADLVKQRDNWKANGKGQSSPEYLALEEKIAESTKKLEEITGKMTAAEKAAADAQIQKRDTDLKSSIIASAGKLKATEPDDIHILLKARDLIGHKEDGTPFFYKLNDKQERVAVNSAEEVVTWLSVSRKDLFAGSGITGTGGSHKAGEPGEGVINHADAKANYRKSRGG